MPKIAYGIIRPEAESKEQTGENSDVLFLGWTVRADIFGGLFLGSQKFSQMAPYVKNSKNEEHFVDINNLLSKKYYRDSSIKTVSIRTDF